jgi:hypothetical protein
MKIGAALLVTLGLLSAMPASAHDVWAEPADVVVLDNPVWVNPGVYVSQYSAVTRNYPYVGCCLPPYENWSYMRPYPSGFGIRAEAIARAPAPVRYSHRPTIEEVRRTIDHLHYPDGKAIERFR